MATGLVIETEQLDFRLWDEADLPLAKQIWGDPDVMSLLGGPMSETAIQTRLSREQATWREIGVQYWPIFLRDTGELAGCAGLMPWGDRPGCLNAGVHLRRSAWGRRLGEQAASAVLRYGFTTAGAPEIVAGHHPRNLASRRLILALGFHFDREELWPPTGLMHPFYRLRRQEWMEHEAAAAT